MYADLFSSTLANFEINSNELSLYVNGLATSTSWPQCCLNLWYGTFEISIILVCVISCDEISHVRYTLGQWEFTYDTYVKSENVEMWKEEDWLYFIST
jgi:hypothetical protein